MFSISLRKHRDEKKENNFLTFIIIKITISSIVIGLKNSYFPLIYLPSCYQKNQPITFKVAVTRVRALLCFWRLIAGRRRGGLGMFLLVCTYFNANFLFLS